MKIGGKLRNQMIPERNKKMKINELKMMQTERKEKMLNE